MLASLAMLAISLVMILYIGLSHAAGHPCHIPFLAKNFIIEVSLNLPVSADDPLSTLTVKSVCTPSRLFPRAQTFKEMLLGK